MRCLAVLLCATAALAGGRDTAAVRLQPVVSSGQQPRVLFPQARFSLSARRPAGAKAPAELTKRARFAVVKLGSKTLTLTFDAPEASPALGLLYTGGKSALGRARPQGKDGFTVEFEGVSCGGLTCNVRLGYRNRKFTGGAIELASHMRGKTVLNGVVRDVVLVDADADGKFDARPTAGSPCEATARRRSRRSAVRRPCSSASLRFRSRRTAARS